MFFHLSSTSLCLFSLNLSFLYFIFYGVSLEVSILHTSPGNQKEIKLWKAFILCFYVSQKGKKLENTAFKRLKEKSNMLF